MVSDPRPDAVVTRSATADDFGELFTLQRAAFVDEARLYDTPSVPALDETFPSYCDRMLVSTTWVAEHKRRIVGAVSLRTYRNETPDIERLMVAPDCRGRGLSSVLLGIAEDHARSAGHSALQLIVGELATDNRAIYSHLGWNEQSRARLAGFEHVVLITMTKELDA